TEHPPFMRWFPGPSSEEPLRTFPVQLMGTSLEERRSSRSRASSSCRPPDERDAERVGGVWGGEDKVCGCRLWARGGHQHIIPMIAGRVSSVHGESRLYSVPGRGRGEFQ